MTCAECGQEKDTTYRNAATGNETVCLTCVQENHPEVEVGKTPGFPAPVNQNVSGPVHHVGDVDISVTDEKLN